MNFIGSFVFDNCDVVFVNSQISPNKNEREQVILAENETILIAEQLTIDAKNINSIVINNHSTSSFTNSRISNFLIGANVKNIDSNAINNHSISSFTNSKISNFLIVANVKNESKVFFSTSKLKIIKN
jgi:hypothetical protein